MTTRLDRTLAGIREELAEDTAIEQALTYRISALERVLYRAMADGTIDTGEQAALAEAVQGVGHLAQLSLAANERNDARLTRYVAGRK